MGDVVQTNQPCDKCGSSDARSIYKDGSSYCFSCKTYSKGSEGTQPSDTKQQFKGLSVAEIAALPIATGIPDRGLDGETCKKFEVRVEFNEATREPVAYYYPVTKEGKITGFKKRPAGEKKFSSIGDTKSPDLFGQWRAGQGGKMIIVTEGEYDAMAATQMLADMGKQYRVVSLPHGANIKDLKTNLDWLEGFDNIFINFDNDKAGDECLSKAVDLFTPGKVKVIRLPVKDANDMLLHDRPVNYLKAINGAKTYQPDGIMNLADSWEAMFKDEDTESVPYPWDGLNKMLYGMRGREIVTLTSGSGMGKSAITRELEHWLFANTEDKIGILALEESVSRTAWGIVSVEANMNLSIREERAGVDPERVKEWFAATLGTGRFETLDHFGSTAQDTLLSRVRYMIKALDCKWIILDHLSIVVSAMEDIGDERKTIDTIMTKLRQLTEETGAGLVLVSHLRRVIGDKGHEQGHEVSLAHLRGSQSIAQLSDAVIGLERNQQADNPKEANLTRVRVLKNRYAGIVGIAHYLYYDHDTGRLTEVDKEDKDEFLGVSPDETSGGF
ncbi:MAG: DnaB-like helicase C-terminal domain-containing protein [Candidatus Thorarchaeota archaeon]|jgi:twinkle protein